MRMIMVVITEVMYSTNLDSDIFQSTASQAPTEKTNKTVPVALRTRNVATKRVKIVLVSRATKVKKSSDITKSTNHTHLCIEALGCLQSWFRWRLFTNDELSRSIIQEMA